MPPRGRGRGRGIIVRTAAATTVAATHPPVVHHPVVHPHPHPHLHPHPHPHPHPHLHPAPVRAAAAHPVVHPHPHPVVRPATAPVARAIAHTSVNSSTGTTTSVTVGGAAVATIVYVGVAGARRRTHLRSTVRIGRPQTGLPVAFEVDVPISKLEDIWDVAIIFDARVKTFRAWQEGDRPPNPLLPAPHGPKPHAVLDLPYALKVNFRTGSAVHTFYSTRACADSGQHFLLVDQSQQQLLPKEYFEEESESFQEPAAKSAEAAAAPSPASLETKQSAEVAPEESPKPVEAKNSAGPSIQVAETASSGKTISEFTVDEVCKWVEGLGMDSEPWRQNTITGKDMEHLSDEDMQGDLGLTRLQVKKIRRELGGALYF